MASMLPRRLVLITDLIGDYRGKITRDREAGEWRYQPDRTGMGRGHTRPMIVLGIGYRVALARAIEIGEQRRGII